MTMDAGAMCHYYLLSCEQRIGAPHLASWAKFRVDLGFKLFREPSGTPAGTPVADLPKEDTLLHKGQQGKKMAGKKASTKAVVALGIAAGLMVGVAAQAHAASVTTIAGEFHERGAVDGTGNQARFEYVQGIVAAPDGTLYVADTGNDMIRKVTVSGGHRHRYDDRRCQSPWPIP